MTKLLEEAAATLNELQRIHNLNAELLETLSVTAQWLRNYAEKHNIPLPNNSTYNSLVNKAVVLIEEISSNNPLSRRKVTDYRTDEDVPEPVESINRGGISVREHISSQKFWKTFGRRTS